MDNSHSVLWLCRTASSKTSGKGWSHSGKRQFTLPITKWEEKSKLCFSKATFSLCPVSAICVLATLWRRTQGTHFSHYWFVLRELGLCKQDRAMFSSGNPHISQELPQAVPGDKQAARRESKPSSSGESPFLTTGMGECFFPRYVAGTRWRVRWACWGRKPGGIFHQVALLNNSTIKHLFGGYSLSQSFMWAVTPRAQTQTMPYGNHATQCGPLRCFNSALF